MVRILVHVTGYTEVMGQLSARCESLTSVLGTDGQTEVALHAAYRDFLTLWKDADPDVPILKEAKAEYAKLQ